MFPMFAHQFALYAVRMPVVIQEGCMVLGVALGNGHLCHCWGRAAHPLCPATVSWASSLTDLLVSAMMALCDLRGEKLS